jgi:hypothetical protein
MAIQLASVGCRRAASIDVSISLPIVVTYRPAGDFSGEEKAFDMATARQQPDRLPLEVIRERLKSRNTSSPAT